MNIQNNERYIVQIQPIIFKIIRFLFIIGLFTLIEVMVSPTFTSAKTITLPAPVKVRAKSCQEERLKLTWKKVKGASGYQIYQYKAKTKKFVKIASVGKKALLWKSAKTAKKHTFKIRAYKKKAKLYDKTIRWTSTNPSIAKVDQKEISQPKERLAPAGSMPVPTMVTATGCG